MIYFYLPRREQAKRAAKQYRSTSDRCRR